MKLAQGGNMLKVIFGYDETDEAAISNAIYEYNNLEGRKTYHESKVRQLNTNRFRCEIWFTLLPLVEQTVAKEKFQFIGSIDIDPNDPTWEDKWKARQGPYIPESVTNTLGIAEAADWFLYNDQ